MATPRVTIDALPAQDTIEDANMLIVQDTGVTKRLPMSLLRNDTSVPLANHIAGTVGAHAATAISAADSGGGINGSTVQSQLAQLASASGTHLTQAAADTRYINTTGDTMTGLLVLSADPSAALGAATKQYVDQAVINAGGGITQAQADARYVNIDGDTMTGILTVSALISTNTGVDLPSGEPSAAQRAARKDYVDNADALRVLKTGDTMTGTLFASVNGVPLQLTNSGSSHSVCQRLRATLGQPTIEWFDSTMTTRIGYLMGIQSGAGVQGLLLAADTGGQVRMRVGASDVATFGASVNYLNISTRELGQFRAFNAAGPQIVAAGQGDQAYIGFYSNATDVDTLGTRSGYVGFATAPNLNIINEDTGYVSLRAMNAAGYIDFFTGGVFEARITAAGDFLLNKTSINAVVQGCELNNSGRIVATTPTASSQCFIANIIGGVASNQLMSLRKDNTAIGSISIASGATSVAYNTTSHGPFKGNVVDIDDDEALARLETWRPVAYQWKFDENGVVREDGTPSGPIEHGFIAQELHEVQPGVVTPGYGTQAEEDAWKIEQQAKAEAGENAAEDSPFMPWGMDASKLIPDLVAAVQAMARKLVALRTELEALR